MARTIPHLLESAVAAAPERTWLVHEDEAFTFADARELAGGAAAALAERGVGRGDLVLAAAHNRPATLFNWFGCMYLGAIWVPTDPRATEAERAGLVEQVAPRVVLGDPAIAGRAEPPAPGAAGETDPAVLIPTSGTTGRSRLVTQTHRGLVLGAEGFPWWMELTAEDRLMTSLPLFHINAMTYTVLGSLAAGASVALLPRFSASGFLDSARRHGATEFNAIGAMLEILMRRPERPDDADTPLRLCYTGPSPPRERQLEIEARFGLRIVCGYAMSETPYGTVWARGTRPFGTIGSVRQHPTLGEINEGRINEHGELELRNPAVMAGYWGMPEETAKVLSPDGWLRTGDLVQEEADGTYTFIGRRKEVIRRRGENVAPAEIEEALGAHPAVLEAAVVGVPSDLSEEEIKAFVVVREGTDLADVRSAAAERLTAFKVPRYLEAVDELPHTPTGRIAKHRLSRERTPAEVDFA